MRNGTGHDDALLCVGYHRYGESMVGIGYVYVGLTAKRNLKIGLDAGTWGWRSEVLARSTFRRDAESLAVGDYMVMAFHGPNPRTRDIDVWRIGTLKRVLAARVVRPLYFDTEPLWPDNVYPERIGLDFLFDERDVPGSTLGDEAIEALRYSGTQSCVAVIKRDPSILVTLGDAPLSVPATDDTDSDDNGSIDVDGDLDSYGRALRRREHRALRQRQIGNATILTCDLCGRRFPRHIVRTAHIKRRSKSTPDERRSLSNVMLACTLGCDELFEHGYVYVDRLGVIREGSDSRATADLHASAFKLSGQVCADFDRKKDYFRWHQEHVAGAAGR